jgi:tetratricopeptide (TPR) repeat protein
MAYYNMGIVYNTLKEYQKAIDAYKEAIKIKPDYHTNQSCPLKPILLSV